EVVGRARPGDDASTLGDQRLGDREPDPLVRPGDHRDLVCEMKVHRSALLSEVCSAADTDDVGRWASAALSPREAGARIGLRTQRGAPADREDDVEHLISAHREPAHHYPPAGEPLLDRDPAAARRPTPGLD